MKNEEQDMPMLSLQDDSSNDLDKQLAYMARISTTLRLLGLNILFATMINMGCVVFRSAFSHIPYSGAHTVWSNQPQSTHYEYVLISMIFGGISVILVGIYDFARSQGDALFEEVSDELQWKIARNDKIAVARSEGYPLVRPKLDARIVLRSFARATNLPIVPGKYGAAVYAIVNICAVLIGAVLNRMIMSGYLR